ncbi:cytochrome P450 [Streptomyces sp. NPDC127068]|uniref:cytochrome P450 n=1 Tax=Streptomyces sp. NPDC127068 TaxID=3347127 RepID=UPI003654ABB9
MPFAGHAWHLTRRPLRFLRAQRAYGDLVAIRIGQSKGFVVNHPELIHRVLTTQRRDFVKGGPVYDALRVVQGNGLALSEGQLHLRQRRLIQPVFHPSRLPFYVSTMRDAAVEATREWADGARVPIARQVWHMTSVVMARCLYAGRLPDRVLDDVVSCLPVLITTLGRRATLPLPWLHTLPTPGNRRFDRAAETLHRLTDELIADCRSAGTRGEDVLSKLLNARDETTGQPMPDQQVHDEAITFLTAATETTASALTSILCVLGNEPEIDRKVYAELSGLLGHRPITSPDLERLPYLRAVITESLRVYPPIWITTRLTARDTTLGGHPIPAGSTVYISPYANHHDPALFPAPDAFWPERWLHDAATPPSCASIPFGAGTRKCVGDEFAVTEMVAILATILRQWRLTPVHGVPLVPVVHFTLSTGRQPMTVFRRT